MPNPESVIEYWEGASEKEVEEKFKEMFPQVLCVQGGIGSKRKMIIKDIMDGFDKEL